MPVLWSLEAGLCLLRTFASDHPESSFPQERHWTPWKTWIAQRSKTRKTCVVRNCFVIPGTMKLAKTGVDSDDVCIRKESPQKISGTPLPLDWCIPSPVLCVVCLFHAACSIATRISKCLIKSSTHGRSAIRHDHDHCRSVLHQRLICQRGGSKRISKTSMSLDVDHCIVGAAAFGLTTDAALAYKYTCLLMSHTDHC